MGSIDQVPQEIMSLTNSQTAYTKVNHRTPQPPSGLGSKFHYLMAGKRTVQRAKIQLDNALIDQAQAELNVVRLSSVPI